MPPQPLDVFHTRLRAKAAPASLFSDPITLLAPSHLVRSQDPGQRRVLDRAARQRRINRQLEALENDNFQDDPHAGLPQLGKRLPQFDDDADTGESGGGGSGRRVPGDKAAGGGKSRPGSGCVRTSGCGMDDPGAPLAPLSQLLSLSVLPFPFLYVSIE